MTCGLTHPCKGNSSGIPWSLGNPGTSTAKTNICAYELCVKNVFFLKYFLEKWHFSFYYFKITIYNFIYCNLVRVGGLLQKKKILLLYNSA